MAEPEDRYPILRKIALDQRLSGSLIRICLLCYKRDVSQLDLISITKRDKSNISRECKKLVEIGYLERTENAETGQGIYYRLRD